MNTEDDGIMEYFITWFDGESGEEIDFEFIYDTKKIKTLLEQGYGVIVDVCNPLANYEDKNIKTDSDGFAMPIKG